MPEYGVEDDGFWDREGGGNSFPVPSAKVERWISIRPVPARLTNASFDFEKGKTQILIGTQMLSKGLDFGNVSVVGILNADNLMNYPDFGSRTCFPTDGAGKRTSREKG